MEERGGGAGGRDTGGGVRVVLYWEVGVILRRGSVLYRRHGEWGRDFFLDISVLTLLLTYDNIEGNNLNERQL